MRAGCLIAIVLFMGDSALASDACSTRAISARADVSVSDGTSFRIESHFRSRDVAAIRHIREDAQIAVVEGPFGWLGRNEKFRLGGGFEKTFALGHQFHAFLLHFDDLVDDARDSDSITLLGKQYPARSGDYPYGGRVHLVSANNEASRPLGMVFAFPEMDPIEVELSDWRMHGGIELPFRIAIHDRGLIFDYRYSAVELAPQSPLWFFDEIEAPDLDPVRVHRLHRKLLAAHCLGDADLMADLSADAVTSANNGALSRVENDALRERFAGLFEQLDYTAYVDLEPPVVEIADSGDIGWIAVNVRTAGKERSSGEGFDHQWAWIMTVRKSDGRWLHAGNASNVQRP